MSLSPYLIRLSRIGLSLVGVISVLSFFDPSFSYDNTNPECLQLYREGKTLGEIHIIMDYRQYVKVKEHDGYILELPRSYRELFSLEERLVDRRKYREEKERKMTDTISSFPYKKGCVLEEMQKLQD